MIELEAPAQPTPRIEEVEADGNLSRFEVSPLQEGYGVTLGNALRRVLLSSLEGAAVTGIQIAGVFHEFSTIDNVKEDVTQIVLNMKKLRLRSFAHHPVTLKLVKHGAGPVTAADIAESADVEIVNPDLVLLTLDSDSGSIEMDITVETGVGYRPAEHTEEMPIGVIPVDAIFSPVRRVNYQVEKTRVGQMTNYDKLSIEIESDGTTTAEAALAQAADILVREFGRFAQIGRPAGALAAPPEAAGAGANLLDAPIEELDLPMRAYNSLKRNNITKIGQLLALSDDELLRMRNFGQKSLDEMKERLVLRGFISADGVSASGSDESDLPASAELDEAAAAELDREA
jgi:DNA-directed RNA polymerase subunit alpha